MNETSITITFRINHFIITQECGSKKYATTLTFTVMIKKETHCVPDEILGLDNRIYTIPKSFCLVSQMPVFELQKYLYLDAFLKKYMIFIKSLIKKK